MGLNERITKESGFVRDTNARRFILKVGDMRHVFLLHSQGRGTGVRYGISCSTHSHRRRNVSKSVWAMASAVARAYNGGLGAQPPAGVQGAEPPAGGQGAKPPEAEAFFSLLDVQRMQEICIFCCIFGV